MEDIYEYIIVEASSCAKLQGAVNSNIRQGWDVQGGVSGFYNLSGYYYQQAMIRVKEVQ